MTYQCAVCFASSVYNAVILEFLGIVALTFQALESPGISLVLLETTCG